MEKENYTVSARMFMTVNEKEKDIPVRKVGIHISCDIKSIDDTYYTAARDNITADGLETVATLSVEALASSLTEMIRRSLMTKTEALNFIARYVERIVEGDFAQELRIVKVSSNNKN